MRINLALDHKRSMPGHRPPQIERAGGWTGAACAGECRLSQHKLPSPLESEVLMDRQKKRGFTLAVKRLRKRRAAMWQVIGHLKAEHRMAAITWCTGCMMQSRPSFGHSRVQLPPAVVLYRSAAFELKAPGLAISAGAIHSSARLIVRKSERHIIIQIARKILRLAALPRRSGAAHGIALPEARRLAKPRRRSGATAGA